MCIRFCLILAVCTAFSSPLSAQSQKADTAAADTTIKKHSPRTAVLYSLIIPGLGQAYNKKYWKIPFIYAGGGTFLYYARYNQILYKKFVDAINDKAEKLDLYGYTVQKDRFDANRDYFRRYRDLSIAGLAAIYLINVIDAMVDAHFFNYDISDDLSMKVEPALIQSPGNVASLGFKINLGF